MLRWAKPSDAAELAQVFFAAVREGPSLYSEAQRAAWLPEPPAGQAWRDQLSAMNVAVVERGGRPGGFMSVQDGGYINLAFVHPDHQGSGIFRQLYARVEEWARDHGEPILWTHASLMAEPAFQAMGFLVIHHETVVRDGQKLTRAKMEKRLT
ncbi:GNAT family N-acetyltransferase [Roseobacter sp. EG26]|uniref:GNAT family N-acetyltransferase n=1 Tax=Roseobacter sp. EG26 TaxID=3412477 RepID=UPI003CE5AAC6